MTRRDLEILIDCVEDAQRTKKAAAEVIADLIVEGKMPTETQVRAPEPRPRGCSVPGEPPQALPSF